MKLVLVLNFDLKLDLALGFTASNAFEIRFAFPSGSFLKKFAMCEYLVTRNIRFFSKSFSLGLNLLGKLSIKNPLCFLESFVRLIFALREHCLWNHKMFLKSSDGVLGRNNN